jgi:XTP/dITP diphosphohydrolase
MDLVLATRNKGKISEIGDILVDVPLTLRSLAEWPNFEEVDESGSSYSENARIKAQAAANHVGLWCLADDSGLEVDALQGRPGVHSARYAGPDEYPIAKLLNEMRGIAEERRTARFVCVVCVCGPNGEVMEGRGMMEGRIALERRGDGGFGYDPVFIPQGDHRHLAEISKAEKNRISHRAHALAAVRDELMKLAGS